MIFKGGPPALSRSGRKHPLSQPNLNIDGRRIRHDKDSIPPVVGPSGAFLRVLPLFFCPPRPPHKAIMFLNRMPLWNSRGSNTYLHRNNFRRLTSDNIKQRLESKEEEKRGRGIVGRKKVQAHQMLGHSRNIVLSDPYVGICGGRTQEHLLKNAGSNLECWLDSTKMSH